MSLQYIRCGYSWWRAGRPYTFITTKKGKTRNFSPRVGKGNLLQPQLIKLVNQQLNWEHIISVKFSI